MIYLKDSYGRKIDYLRVSITDRCNLRCRYCMPLEGIVYKAHKAIIRYEEIIRIVRAGVELGIRKIRITGGEPLVRRGVVDFVRQLNRVKGIVDISMTTNGTLLPKFGRALRDAGLKRINISLDSLKRERYVEITRREQFDEAIEGIKTALEVGFNPVKINVVIMKGINDDEVLDFVRLTREFPLHIRFIEFMPLGKLGLLQSGEYMPLNEIKARIEEKEEILPATLRGNGPAEYYKIPYAQGTIGFITPISHNFCANCNRMRLTANGKLRPCLASDLEVDMHDSNGEIRNMEDIKEKFKKAIRIKPIGHDFVRKDYLSKRSMFQIGG